MIEREISEVLNYEPEIGILKSNYEKFKDYLKKVESEIKGKYKNEEEIEIKLKIKMQNYGEYNVNCIFCVGDEEFTEEKILGETDYTGLGCFVNKLDELNEQN